MKKLFRLATIILPLVPSTYAFAQSNPNLGQIVGTVYDTNCNPLPNVLIELAEKHTKNSKKTVTQVDRNANRGFDLGTDLNDPNDDLILQLPDFSQLDLRLQYSLKPLIKENIIFIVDTFNLLNLRTSTRVVEQDSKDFGKVISRQNPLSIQLGVRYLF